MDCGKSWCTLAAPSNFSPSSTSSMKVSKVRWSTLGLCWAVSLSPTVSSRDVFCPHIFLHLLQVHALWGKRERLLDSIYICFRTDSNLFNLWHLLTCTKTIEELITELLFVDDCTLPAHTEEALQFIVNHFSDAAKNLTLTLKKTEVLYQAPPWDAYSPPHISIDGTNLTAVEHFTYLGCVISNNASQQGSWQPFVQSQQFLWKTVRESVAESVTPSLHKDPDIQGHHHSYPPVQCRDLGSLSEPDQATGAVSPMLPVFHPWHQMARPYVERRSPQESQPAQHRVHLASGVAALGWPHHKMEDIRMPKAVFFSELQEGKHDRGAPRKRCKDQLKRQLAKAGISHQSLQQEASDRDSWCSLVRKGSSEFKAERHKATKEKHRWQKEWAASQPSSSQTFICPKCGRVCSSRIGLYSHQWACKNWPSTFSAILVCEEWAVITCVYQF